MIIIGNKQIISKIYTTNPYNNKSVSIAALYKGNQLLWRTTYTVTIRSCYGSGEWLDNYNWVDDTWKD